MFFTHENMIKKEGKFILNKHVTAKANKVLINNSLKEFWHGHSFSMSVLDMDLADELIFKIGDAEKIDLNGNAYTINVDVNGIFISASNEKNLIYGFITLLDLIKMTEAEYAEIECCEISENPTVNKRMAHFCLFPDTKLWEAEKFIKLCGALKYSHIVFESWGMIKLDALKELSWEHGYEKEEIKKLVKLANDLGMEVIPMYNHWGHATASRVMHGKHVVLDQNPTLQYLFSEDGWRWRIESPYVKNLLRKIRIELCELCGDSEYFHIGCDEAYGFKYAKNTMDEIAGFISEVKNELKDQNRKTIMWADMLLSDRKEYNKNNSYVHSADCTENAEYMMSVFDKDIIMADWQYWIKEAPVETSINLKKSGFNVLICPFDVSYEGSNACLETAKTYGLDGIIHTTWHTLSEGYPYIAKIAYGCWCNNTNVDELTTKTAAIVRKLQCCNGVYEKAGWSRYQIGTRW